MKISMLAEKYEEFWFIEISTDNVNINVNIGKNKKMTDIHKKKNSSEIIGNEKGLNSIKFD